MTSIPCSAQDSPTPESDRSLSVSSAEAGNPALCSADTREGKADGGPGPSNWPRAQSCASRPCEEEKGALWPLCDSGKHLVRLDPTTTWPGEDPSPRLQVSLSRVRLLGTPWCVGRQAPLTMEFSRQEDWSGLPFPQLGDLPDPGTEPWSPELQADSLLSEP